MTEHRVILSYTGSDDGIWLECSCKWQHNLGWDPTPTQAWTAEQEHLRTVGSKDPEPGIQPGDNPGDYSTVTSIGTIDIDDLQPD